MQNHPRPSLDKHVIEVRRSVRFQTRALRYVQSAISRWRKLHALVRSRFDYANAIPFGPSKYNILMLQRSHSALVRVILRSHQRENVDGLLLKLRCLTRENKIFLRLLSDLVLSDMLFRQFGTISPDNIKLLTPLIVLVRS